MTELRLGVNIFGDKLTGPKYAQSIDANFIQVFLKSPQSYVTGNMTSSELKAIKKQLKKHDCGCVVHSSYTINLARPPDQYQHFKGVEVIADDMTCAYKMGAIGAIIHMGKNVLKLPEKEAINNYVTGVESALKSSHKKSILILETGAGVGTEICSKLKELGNIRKKVDKKLRHRVKFCIDTCHVFAVGYELHKKSGLKKFCKEIDKYLGWENVAVIHLNDSQKPCGCKKDCHAIVGNGEIGFDPLIKFVQICSDNGVPIVMEPPKSKKKDEEKIKKRIMCDVPRQTQIKKIRDAVAELDD